MEDDLLVHELPIGHPDLPQLCYVELPEGTAHGSHQFLSRKH